MIGSGKYKIIGVLIPRTGTKSLRRAIINADPPSMVQLNGLHSPYLEYLDFKPVTIVRNPFDRMVSLYHWSKSYGVDQDFDDWIKTDRYMRKRDMFGWWRSPPLNRAQQLLWFNGFKINALRFENIDGDWERFCLENNIPYKELEHTHASKRSHYRDYYSKQSREWVERYFADDLRIFGYDY